VETIKRQARSVYSCLAAGESVGASLTYGLWLHIRTTCDTIAPLQLQLRLVVLYKSYILLPYILWILEQGVRYFLRGGSSDRFVKQEQLER